MTAHPMLNFENRERLARSTDPSTSHEAARELTASGRRDSQKHAVLVAVRLTPGRTSAELAEWHNLDRYMVARRLPDLEADGLVCKGEARPCAVSGRRAVVWRLK